MTDFSHVPPAAFASYLGVSRKQLTVRLVTAGFVPGAGTRLTSPSPKAHALHTLHGWLLLW
jgi:hypothetical protein